MSLSFLFIVLLVLLLFLGIPVAFSTSITPLIIMIIEKGSFNIDTAIIATKMFSGINKFTILAIPLFLLAGRLMNVGSMTDKIFKFADVLIGHWKGGMGHTNILASVIFSGMTGSALSDAAGLGIIELKAMRDAGYDDDFSIAITGASSIIGPIIPPSIALVIYAVLAGASVGKVLIAGIIPGIIMAGVLMIMVTFYVRKKNYPTRKKASFSEIWHSFYNSILELLTPIIIIGGMLSGIFTATEAAAIAVLYAFIIGAFVYKEINFKNMVEILYETAKDTACIMFIMSAATFYGWLLIRSRIPIIILEFLTSITQSRLMILIILNLFLLFIGCFMETIAALTIVVPIIIPILSRFQIDPVHFGVIIVLNLVIGLLTPPFGEVLFVLHKISKVPLERIVKCILPFLIPLFITLILVTIFPPIATWLPSIVFIK
ncbi:MAG: TRAP transporter large permease [Atribacterota bacterium]|nr:TRAP transporter large permease [Atribacterota bacterium]